MSRKLFAVTSDRTHKFDMLSFMVWIPILLAIVWASLGSVAGASAMPNSHFTYATGSLAQFAVRLEPVDCSAFKGLDVSSAAVECGYLIAPENRSNPQSRTIKVAYTIVKARGSNPAPDPVVYLTGGPGDNAIRDIDFWAGMPMSKNRDIILVDPRGVGYSLPALQCPANTLPDAAEQASAPGAGEALAQKLEWARACRDLLAGQGFDLTTYNSAASASDLNDLRLALGYSQWNLYGTSYGTRVALVTMRMYPAGIRSVVLDSVLPPQVDRIGHGDLAAATGSLSALFAACKADAACSRDYRDLETKFDETVQRLDRNPVKVTVTDGNGGNAKRVWIRGADIVGGIKAMMMYPYLIQIAPIAIAQVHAGDTTGIERLYTDLASGDNQAVYNTVLCHDVGALFNPELFHAELDKYPALKSFYTGDEQATICQLWGAGQADREESQPVSSDIPTLLLTGGNYDFASSANSRLAASTLSRNFLYEFPAYSHYVTVNECPQAMMADFLDDPSRAPDASCMAQIKGLPFVTDVYRNPGVFNIFVSVQTRPVWLSIALGVIGLLFLSAVVVLPVTYLRSRRQTSGRQPLPNAARVMLWVVAVLNMVFGIGTWLLVRKALAENYGWVTLFGFSPTLSKYLFVLPWLTALLALGLLAFAVLAWKSRWWGRLLRIWYSLGTLAALSWAGLLIYWKVLSL